MIYFPGFNLSFSIHSIAFKLFGVPIYFYAICIVLGIIVAIGLSYMSKEKFEIRIWIFVRNIDDCCFGGRHWLKNLLCGI